MNDQDHQQQQQQQPPQYFYNEEIEDTYVSGMVYHDQQQQQQATIETIVDPGQGSPIPSYDGLQNVAEPRGYLIASFFVQPPNHNDIIAFFHSIIISSLYILAISRSLAWLASRLDSRVPEHASSIPPLRFFNHLLPAFFCLSIIIV